ncbi:hypothetical protein MTQ89_08395 [Staphylococcus hyicus]|uniref:hypothetical protein n=1 Tax=Staphylococcus hyicus TaxID=1284 RepID=UPI00208FB75D|nr:hypothetical protein [Staphylococcus hyicus]MCO4335823.1 hypothetical protein [Staphylococcus hyicus]MCO4336757.1 hypothetical protein [Staphylococcus hyicus]
MNREKLLRIQRELDRCRIYSDAYCEITGRNDKDGHNSIAFFHFDDRYEFGLDEITIYDFEKEIQIEEKVQKIKDVIAGEALIDE